VNRRSTALLSVSLSLAAPVHAQVRDARPLAATGTGTIIGTVVTGDAQPRPVRRAVVTLNSVPSLVGRTTVTDDEGRFTFAGLPEARYSLAATKRGWVTGSYGASAIGRPGRTLPLAAGSRASVTIRMAAGAVIAGTIVDQFGQPLAGARLRVMKYGYSALTGDRRLNQVGFSSSEPDDRGAYRVYGLAPGDYYVSVTSNATPLASGRDLHLTSDVDVEDALQAAQRADTTPPADVAQPNVGFAQIFYPGTAAVAQATPITLRAGEERTGVDFLVSYSPTVHVEGTVTSPAGMPVAARVSLVANDPTSPSMGIESIHSTTASVDGRFAFSEIAPGPYVLSAHGSLPPEAPDTRPQVLTGTTDLDVTPDGANGVVLALQPGLTVSGVLRYEGAAAGPNLSSLRVSLAAEQSGSGVTISTASGTTVKDGQFTFTGVSPGRYRLSVGQTVPPAPWRVRSATMLGQDALDLAVEVRQNVADAAITLSDQLSALTGRLESAGAGAAASDTMVLFSTDRAHWRPQSRRIMTSRVATDGSFAFADVPPGDYQLAPAEDVEPGEWFDPAFLQRLSPAAIHVTIAEGENKVQNVRLGG